MLVIKLKIALESLQCYPILEDVASTHDGQWNRQVYEAFTYMKLIEMTSTQYQQACTNATIYPVSLLPFKTKYSQIAHRLPIGSILIPITSLVLSKPRSALVKVAAFLRSEPSRGKLVHSGASV